VQHSLAAHASDSLAPPPGPTRTRGPWAAPAPPLEVRVSRHFLAWLAESGASLAFKTY
jgi:hypothetical protein